MRPPFDHLSYLYYLIELYHLYDLMSTEKAASAGILIPADTADFIS